ncbi:MAG: mismatch repair protein MutS2 [Bacillota bacterium]|nr:mismatch repair protein MutS2 [Bacillota bacterium]MDK2856616.1 mismatch repair protein MutS2 [Bacillota bacterium]MDK2926156.1 mismatch repair protein MutS2 [Bacillota bacterium]
MTVATVKTKAKLDWDKITALLAAQADTPLGAELAQALEPSADPAEVDAWQAETAEGRELVERGITVPLAGVADIRRSVERCRRGGTASIEELYQIRLTLEAGRRVKSILTDEVELPLLQRLGGEMPLFPELEEVLRRSVASAEDLADEASPELLRLRREKKRLVNAIRSQLEEMVRSPAVQKYLQEPIITMRGDRYVLPVKQEWRQHVPGVVHDQSASGATLFIEPLTVFQLGNSLREIEAQERHEVERVLGELARRVGEQAEGIGLLVAKLARLDFIMAKGRLAAAQDAVRPYLNSEGRLNIRLGRHPLLGAEAVPISLPLGQAFRILVVTGPNTGGKTVTLKTVGLFALMHQAGLHVPAAPDTELPVYDRIFCDLGDEQSIEQSLSTFSSHMKNIVGILAECTQRSLVLLDELGAGTDPAEGAALAKAILEHLAKVGVSVIATTHYSELKVFAYSHPGIENASVEFDPVTLKPTYRLLIGLPGRSNAFEIAARLGLPEPLVSRARAFLSQADVRADDLIRSLEEKRLYLEKLQKDAEAARTEAERLKNEWEAKRAAFEAQKDELLRRAKGEAVSTLNYARREAERIIRELRAASSNLIEKERMLVAQQARQRLTEAQERVRHSLAEEGKVAGGKEAVGHTEFKAGQTVFIPHLNLTGTLLNDPDANGNVRVQVGVLKVDLNTSQLRLQEGEKKRREERSLGALAASKARSISPELDLRGLTVGEAEYRVEKYLDDAHLAGLEKVRLIHGKGTGALRQAVQNLLARHPHVESFSLADYREGGTGVTVAVLKK